MRRSTGLFNAILAAERTAMAAGVIRLYATTSIPTSPNDAIPSGSTLIATITVDGGAWAAGTSTNGLNFDAPVLNVLSKAAAETWRGTAVAAGTITWARFVSNSASDTGASSTTLSRIDFTVGISSGDLRLAKVTYAIGDLVQVTALTDTLTNIA